LKALIAIGRGAKAEFPLKTAVFDTIWKRIVCQQSDATMDAIPGSLDRQAHFNNQAVFYNKEDNNGYSDK
jgi:hypothetical protein